MRRWTCRWLFHVYKKELLLLILLDIIVNKQQKQPQCRKAFWTHFKQIRRNFDR